MCPQVRSTHRDCKPTVIDARGGGGRHDPEVKIEKHEGRFINLQRLLFKPSKEAKAVLARAASADEHAFVKVGEVIKVQLSLSPLSVFLPLTVSFMMLLIIKPSKLKRTDELIPI